MGESYSNFLSLQIMLREATKLLRQIFLQTWKELYQKDWTDDVEASIYFRNGPGKEIRDSCKKIQQVSLDLGNSGEWDITLLGTVLTSKLFTQILKKKSYLQPVSKISSVRNKTNHTAKIELSDEIFGELSNELISAMIALGALSENVLKLKDNKAFQSESLVTNSDQKAQSVKESANEEFKKKNYVKAIEIYTSAINLPSLTNQELGVLYRNRSLSYLKLYDETKDEINLYRALIDVEKTCSHHPVWFKGYAQLGEIYCKMNKFNKAVECFEKALAFSFNSEEMKNSLTFAKFKLGEQQRYDNLNKFPFSTEEHEEQFFQKLKKSFCGTNIENLNLIDFKNKLVESDPTLKIVWTGHDFRDGSKTVKQDYEMAAKFYSKAAQRNNAEGMYNLALLLMKGLGVKADFKAAIALLKDAAKEKPTHQLLGQEVINVGVCEAEHSLGLAYQEGINVAKDDRKASKWYQLAVEHGSVNSANYLGIMYLHGTGVKKDIKEAERLFILAHERGDINASGNLVDLYILEGDPDRALIWHERSLQTPYTFSNTRDGEIREKIQSLKNIEQLRDSSFNDQKVALESVLKYKHNFMDSLETTSTPCYKGCNFNMQELLCYAMYAMNGSITAKEMLKALGLFYEALSMLKEQSLHAKGFLMTLASAYSIYQIVCQMPPDKFEEVLKIVNSVIQENQNQNSEIDYHARLCFVYLNPGDQKLLINFLKCSLSKYPDDSKMLHLLGCSYAFLNQYENALEVFEKAYSLQPSNYEYIYNKAVAFRLLDNKDDEAKCFYEKFISTAPADHCKLPESYYALGLILSRLGNSTESSMISFYYNKGLESEKLQLSCFLPYESTSKEFLKQHIMITETKITKTVLLEKFEEINNKENDEFINNKRKDVFLNHRQGLKELKKISLRAHQRSFKLNKYQTITPSVIGLKPVFLKDIDFSKDYILTGHALTVTNVDIPIIGVFSSVHFVVEDEKRFVEKLCIYNLGENYKSIKEKFPVGCIFTIIDPYVKFAADGKPMIKVDNPDTVIMSGKRKLDMCLYCGKEQSMYTCSRCKTVKYCSKQCQNNDWKLLNHKDVCKYVSSFKSC